MSTAHADERTMNKGRKANGRVAPAGKDPALAARLRAVMEESNLTMAALAKKCGVTRPAVSNWLKEGTISRKHLYNVAQACGTTVDYLTSGVHPEQGHSIPGSALARRFDALPRQQQTDIWPALDLILTPRRR